MEPGLSSRPVCTKSPESEIINRASDCPFGVDEQIYSQACTGVYEFYNFGILFDVFSIRYDLKRHNPCSSSHMFLRNRLNDFRFFTKTLSVFLTLSGVAACSSDNVASSNQTAPPSLAKHEIYRGPLYLSYRAIQESSYREKCDQSLNEIQSTLISALDLKTADILNYSYSQPHSSVELMPFGKSYLLNKEKLSAKKGWQEEAYSWRLAYDYYQKHSQENDSHFWTTLNAYVRSLITDDRKRQGFR